jgi:hypothetical protein
MPNRFVILLLSAATVAFARGSTSHKSMTATSRSHQPKNAPIVSALAVNVGDGVRFKLNVTNTTNKMVELKFRNGFTHDFYVVDDSGKEIWRWSTGRMFTQAMRTKLVKSRDEATFSNEWRPMNLKGHFTAVAVLKSANHPIEERVEFALN